MPLILRRSVSSKNISTQTQSLAERLLSKFHGNPIKVFQYLDGNQLQRLSLTLGRPNLFSNVSIHKNKPGFKTPLPPGYHLVYFTPAALPHELGLDGTDMTFSPDYPFTRRMWAGGEVRWNRNNPLRVGDLATETTKLLSAEPKMTRAGEEMIVVGIEKTVSNADGEALVDKRDWVFRTEISASPSAPTIDLDLEVAAFQLPAAAHPEVKTRDFCQSSVDLFRFSALTSNAHKIHYSRPWCRQVEGHREIVVHGPLNLINMLDFWRDTRAQGDYEVPKSIRYRAVAPFYADEKYRALLEEGEDGATHVKLWGNNGKGDVRVGMMGDIVGF